MSTIEPAAPARIVRCYAGEQRFDWNDERIETLKKLWDNGESATQIAAFFGNALTRSAVLGKVHRLKLTKRNQPRADRHREIRLKKRRPIKRWRRDGTTLKLMESVTGIEPALPADHAPNPTSLLELTTEHCRWPAFGEGINTTFCGDQAVDGMSYCAHHCRIAYRAPARRTPAGEAARMNRKIHEAIENAA